MEIAHRLKTITIGWRPACAKKNAQAGRRPRGTGGVSSILLVNLDLSFLIEIARAELAAAFA
jgi:hypothetical protein